MSDPTPRRGRATKTVFALTFLFLLASVVEFVVASLDVAPPQTPLMVVFTQRNDEEIRKGEGAFQFDHRWLWEPRPASTMWGSTVNEDGYRGPRYPVDRAAKLRIATLGDSSTFGHGLKEELCWSRQLEDRLRDDGVDVEVLNFGVIGFSALQGHRLYLGRVRDYRPDVVIAAFGAVNDSFAPPSNIPDAAKIGLMSRPMYRARMQLKRYATFRFLEQLLGATPQYSGTKGIAISHRVSEDEFETTLDQLNQVVTEDGGRLVLVSPPRRLDGERKFPGTTKYTDSIERVAERLSLPLTDVHTDFRRDQLERLGERADDPDAGAISPLFNDEFHPSIEGHARYARLVERTLQGAGLIER